MSYQGSVLKDINDSIRKVREEKKYTDDEIIQQDAEKAMNMFQVLLAKQALASLEKSSKSDASE